MRCLILAAGLGSRLRDRSESKPLTPVGGAPLIEHVVRHASEGGAHCITVVTGYRADRLEAFLDALATRLDLAIDTVRISDWSKPNGHSLLAGTARIEDDYLLSMADHLFDPDIIRRLASEPRGHGVTLAIDRDLSSPLLDLDDATKVALGPGGAIRRIGKGLDRFDAIDTGLFRAGPGLADAVRADIATGGEGSLSAGVQRLADEGAARTLDVTGARWIDVDDARSLDLAEAYFFAGQG